ncbi:MAG TPA: hypothetical protein DF383_11025 [Deltaproteobacteria bacterium]|nr:hypothetical protein [Deltaproteobacteria bacterium]
MNLEPFHILQKIGEGSFGEVYLAFDPRLEKQVAVKTLRLEADSPNFSDAVALFKREFELLRELKHPHLADVYDFGFDEARGQYFFSEEYCPGQDCREAFRNRPIDFFEDILAQTLSALDYIHAQGVVHSDIKPENIMVDLRDTSPFVKLMDFGVAGRLRSSRRGFGGTPAYMAPELLGPNPRADPRSDLYSLGMLAVELLFGKMPFDRKDARSAVAWHLHGKIPESLWRSREIPPYLRELIEKLLKKNPSERFSNARVVMNFLNLATGGRYQKLEAGLGAEIPREGPLVERREEVLDALQQRLLTFFHRDPAAATPELHYLSGERGVGKSRLLEELKQFLAVHEIPCHLLRIDWEIPVWPKLVEALGMPAWQHDSLEREWQVLRRIDALRQAAMKQPLCLLIDDFHKADPDFQESILRLWRESRAENAAPAPLFLVAAGEEPLEEGTRLRRLSLRGVMQYVQGVLGMEERHQALADMLFLFSGGLPLLVAEGLRYMAPSYLRGEGLQMPPAAAQIAVLYRDKIARLSPVEEDLLQRVALLFRPVPETQLLAILRVSEAELSERLKPALRLGLLAGRTEALSENKYAMVYQVSSQALAGSLIKELESERRRELHRSLAEGLQSIDGISSEEIAYHLAKAGELGSAAIRYEAAARTLQSQGQISSAARCFAKSIELLSEGSERWRELVTESARLRIISGSYREAEEALQKLADYSAGEDEPLRGWLAFKQREFDSARRHYQAALQKLSLDQWLQRILLENALANVDLQEGKPGDAVLRFRKTLQWEEKVASEQRGKINNNNLGIALVLRGDAAGALQFYEDRAALLEEKFGVEDRITLLNGKSYVCLQTGRYEEAIACLKKAMNLAESSGAFHSLSSIMGNLVTALLKESRYAESLPLLQKIVTFQERLGSHRDVAYNLLRQGSVYLTLGMGEQARACFQAGKSHSHSDKNLSLWYLLVEGYWEREHGSPERAESLFRRLEEEAGRAANAEIVDWAIYAQADLAFERKKISAARSLLSRIAFATQDKEFLARLHLLEAKLSAFEKGKDVEKLFAEVESECLQGHYREILWELYHDWALSREKRQGYEAASPLFQQGVRVVEAIVSSLPEEYRDRYLNQRQRKKLFADWRQSRKMPRRMTSRLKEFLRL